MPDYQQILQTAFPDNTFGDTARAIREGIALGDDTINGIPLLNTPVGKDIRGLIRRAAVMHRIHQLCEIGDLPFEAEFTPMPIGSWHWLEIRSGLCRGYLVRTKDKYAFPDDTPNQQDKRHSNQIDLFDDPKIVPMPHANTVNTWLCYGANKKGATTHAIWGVPSGDEAETWLARRDILNVSRAAIHVPKETKRPKVDPRNAMKFRDEIQEAIEARQRDEAQFGDED